MSVLPAVQRMSGFDAGFFYSETPAVHQHILLTLVLEPHPSVTYDNVVAGVLDRLDLLPPLRRRTVHVPLWLHHPVWVTVPEVDVAHHFRRTPVGGSGSRQDLDALMGEIASTPLDPRHPLWELHVTEGLVEGRTAVILKLHHSLADGAVVNTLLDNVVDVPSGPRPPTEVRASTAALPGRVSLVGAALRDVVVGLVAVPALLYRTLRGALAAAAYTRKHQAQVPTPILSSPRVSFNGSLTPRRRLATVDLPMAQIRSIRAQHPGSTVNDVLLGVVSGALRRWLVAHGEHPSRSLITGIPVGVDAPGAPRRLGGNNLSNLFATLATDVEDPTERLQAIATSMRHAKELDRLRGPEILQRWFQVVPGPAIAGFGRTHTRLGLPDRTSAPFTLQISNTPGPRGPVQVGPVRISALRSTGPLLQGNGLAVIAWSYAETMNVTLMACPDLFPDVETLATYFPAAAADYDTLAP